MYINSSLFALQTSFTMKKFIDLTIYYVYIIKYNITTKYIFSFNKKSNIKYIIVNYLFCKIILLY